MDIYIITIHKAINYGAILQAYGLQKYLNSKGHSSTIIDYQPSEVYSQYDENKKLPLVVRTKRFLKNIIIGAKNSRYHKFKEFYSNNLIITRRTYYHEKDLMFSQQAEPIFLAGSDQIWNADITGGGILPAYFLSFVSDVRKISYASSFGKDHVSKEEEAQICKLLKSYKHISVREESGRNILEKLSFANISVVLDPVFLLNKQKWSNLVVKTDYTDYTLVYKFGNDTILEETIKQFKQMTKRKVILITESLLKDPIYDVMANGVGPREFLSLFMNASFIITNTFHGTAFSIIFEKQFISISHSITDSRMVDLLKIVNLQNHFIASEHQIKKLDELEVIQYSQVNELLDKQIKYSKDYLNTAISDES